MLLLLVKTYDDQDALRLTGPIWLEKEEVLELAVAAILFLCSAL